MQVICNNIPEPLYYQWLFYASDGQKLHQKSNLFIIKGYSMPQIGGKPPIAPLQKLHQKLKKYFVIFILVN
jgi:hypothetical protein